MSNSPLVSFTKISPAKNSPRKSKIDTITIHCYVGQVTVERMGRGFGDPNATASCNYGIGYDGRIGMYVEEKDRSWCSSNKENDHRAITIEVASDSEHPYEVRDAAYNSLIDLLEDICRRNDIKELNWKADKKLIGKVDQQNMTVHRWFANKVCPGQYLYSRHGQIADEVNKRLGVVKPVVSTPIETKPTVEVETVYSLKSFVKDIQQTCGAKVDGIAGKETISKTPTISARRNRKHAVVKYIQKRLYALGYTEVGAADGIAGSKFTSAVKRYQTENGCISDGEITAKKTTWRKLLGME